MRSWHAAGGLDRTDQTALLSLQKSGKSTAGGFGASQNQTTAMRLSNPAGNRKPQPRAAAIIFRTGAGFVGAKETLEDPFLQIGRDAFACICDAQCVFRSQPITGDGYVAAGRR